jgi:hypothetical protein
MAASLEELRRTGAEFLIADLEMGITFTELALSSKDQAVIVRNRRNALKAYDTVSKLAPKSRLNEAESKAVTALLARLKEKLVLLGEEVA